jgi:hypothetical protein
MFCKWYTSEVQVPIVLSYLVVGKWKLQSWYVLGWQYIHTDLIKICQEDDRADCADGKAWLFIILEWVLKVLESRASVVQQI